MKYLKYVIIFLLVGLFFPLNASAGYLYEDKIHDIVGVEASEKITIYFFHSDTCPHCKEENAFLDSMQKKYGDKILIYRYEVSSSVNDGYMTSAKKRMGSNSSGIPFTVIGDKYYPGYSKYTGETMDDTIAAFIEGPSNPDDPVTDPKEDEYITIPIFGKVKVKEVSLPIVTVVLGLLDGFNPCAMWVLLFLINILLTLNDKKKTFLIGGTFLFISALVYFLAMLGIGLFLNMAAVVWVRRIIALVAVIGGIMNLNTYIKTRKDDGCHVVDEKKRKKYLAKIKKISSQKNLILAVIGVALLAFSITIVEFACTAGFPAIFMSLLKLNDITGLHFFIYMMLYILMFMLIQLIIFFVAIITSKITGVTTKYTKWVHLIGGIIMILLGILLIFKPECVMFNF